MNDRINKLKIPTDKILLNIVSDGLTVINDYINKCTCSDSVLIFNSNSKIFTKVSNTAYGSGITADLSIKHQKDNLTTNQAVLNMYSRASNFALFYNSKRYQTNFKNTVIL